MPPTRAPNGGDRERPYGWVHRSSQRSPSGGPGPCVRRRTCARRSGGCQLRWRGGRGALLHDASVRRLGRRGRGARRALLTCDERCGIGNRRWAAVAVGRRRRGERAHAFLGPVVWSSRSMVTAMSSAFSVCAKRAARKVSHTPSARSRERSSSHESPATTVASFEPSSACRHRLAYRQTDHIPGA